jgi:hypothetical protein
VSLEGQFSNASANFRKSRLSRVARCSVSGWPKNTIPNLDKLAHDVMHDYKHLSASIFVQFRSILNIYALADVCSLLRHLMFASRYVWRVHQIRPTAAYLQRRTSWTSHFLPLLKSLRQDPEPSFIQRVEMPERSSKDPLVWVDCEVNSAPHM